MWFSTALAPWLVAVIDLMFVPILAAKIASQLIKRPKPQNMVFLLLLSCIWIANLMTHLEWMGVSDTTLDTGLRAGLVTLCAMIAILGGRVTPAFTRNAMKRASAPESSWPVSVALLDKASMITALVLPISVLALGPGPVAGGVALILGGLQVLRLSRWRSGWALRQPILIALHIGMGMLALGLLLWGASLLGFGSEIGALHVLGIGCVGGMTLAIMSRAALGHSGRDLVAPFPVTIAYGAMALAAILRWVGSGLGDHYLTVMLLADGFWICALTLYLFAMWPALAGHACPVPEGGCDGGLDGVDQRSFVLEMAIHHGAHLTPLGRDMPRGSRDMPGIRQFRKQVKYFRPRQRRDAFQRLNAGKQAFGRSVFCPDDLMPVKQNVIIGHAVGRFVDFDAGYTD